eukprot:gnl/MRDRNA2_/MRDRNA2_99432_c0_seq1.p1 gnl/MRDRNA2_/MRDRNA2_99432_c0~~gnl/MRDRNA2_/MRDRNA2_99432_c0_seq1.p1  ORF type:complete len:624 (+),score=166.35 gnl/MRDRNA2_/MRDRNA2_99432_c0_seq1:98-1969(+)
MPVRLMGIRCPVVYAFIGTISAWGFGKNQCTDAETCKKHVSSLTGELEEVIKKMQAKSLTLDTLDGLRRGLLKGEHVPVPSGHHPYLKQTLDMIYDAKHAPVVTNISKHLTEKGTIAEDTDAPIAMMTLMPIKRGAAKGKGPSAVLISLDRKHNLYAHSLTGEKLLGPFDIGHEMSRKVTMFQITPNQDNPHILVTADDGGVIVVTEIKAGEKKVKKQGGDGDKGGHAVEKEKAFGIQASIGATFQIPQSTLENDKAPRKLTTVLPVDRGHQAAYLVTGDDQGGISVFFQNGTLRGRTRVTFDQGGVVSLVRGSGVQVAFGSSHHVGYLSLSQVDMTYAPCSGWSSPLISMDLDRAGSDRRLLLSLANGEVLAIQADEKTRMCDVSFKYPTISTSPHQVKIFRGYSLALPTTENRLRELYVMNHKAMEMGYSAMASSAVTMRLSFAPKVPASFAIHSTPEAGFRAWLAVLMQDGVGVELFELNLKKIPSPGRPFGGGGGGGGGSSGGGDGGWEEDLFGWLNSVPKIVYFLIVLVPVVIWNVKKGTAAGKSKLGKEDDFDDWNFKDKAELQRTLKKRREEKDRKRAAEKEMEMAKEDAMRTKQRELAEERDFALNRFDDGDDDD